MPGSFHAPRRCLICGAQLYPDLLAEKGMGKAIRQGIHKQVIEIMTGYGIISTGNQIHQGRRDD